jgi:hypothetical protein
VKTSLPRLAGQIVAFALFCALIGYCSSRPAYPHRSPDDAQLTVAFAHSGAPVRECRRRTPEEIAALAPNMRRPSDCPRARVVLRFVLKVDDRTLIDDAFPPAGVANDGEGSVYRRIAVPMGVHRIEAFLRDSRREAGYDWHAATTVDLAARRNFTIDFSPEAGGFVFR